MFIAHTSTKVALHQTQIWRIKTEQHNQCYGLLWQWWVGRITTSVTAESPEITATNSNFLGCTMTAEHHKHTGTWTHCLNPLPVLVELINQKSCHDVVHSDNLTKGVIIAERETQKQSLDVQN